MQTTVKMIFEKETAGAVRYQEIGEGGKPRKGDADGAVLGQLYIRKVKIGASIPQALTITIEG